MAFSEVIKFGGSPDDLVWKYPGEEFNTTSQLIVDDTHYAVLVVNGQTTDVFSGGRHTLSVPNIPLLKKIISIPTDGKTPFQCKIFYISRVHQMDLLWGTEGAIALEDPLYQVFLHVMMHGSLTCSLEEATKFLLKLVGFRNVFRANDMVLHFRGLISSHVKDCISKIMINGLLSYFMINAHLFEISGVVKERLQEVFTEYGIHIDFFNIETIEVPREDYEEISAAKTRRAGRLIEGYTWQEERQMLIAEKFAGNEGSMGAVGGAVGGFMMGGALGGSISEIARAALSPDRIPTQAPPHNVADVTSTNPGTTNGQGFDVGGLFGGGTKPPENPPQTPAPPTTASAGGFCTQCGAPLVAGAKFCSQCGSVQQTQSLCPNCGKELQPGQLFCPFCGTKL